MRFFYLYQVVTIMDGHYSNFHLHWCFSFFVDVLVDTLIKEKRLFFVHLQFHTKKNTLPKTKG